MQATFTYQNKLGLGFAYALLPGLKTSIADKDEFAKKVETHAQYFNTHPYLSSYVLGTVQNLEEESNPSDKTAENHILTLKNRLSGILGSLGDRLFWKYLKPLTSVFAIAIISLFSAYYPLNIALGITIFILTFNIFHLFYRYKGLTDGYSHGIKVAKTKSITRIEKLNLLITGSILFFVGFLVMVLGFDIELQGEFWGVVIFVACGLFVFILNLKKALQEYTIIGGIILSVIIYFLSNIL